jgi:hypothetical protein
MASNVIQLKKVKRQRAEAKSLCVSGFHKWEVVASARFDVHEGKLITPERCKRCGKERVRLS